ncbi:MAG: potassium-transporting ATPase subunit KdpC [Chloroflexi bacterium]|nr:potassium-transporting ATPase subunit KdpC [Chloroflexota bacterium]
MLAQLKPALVILGLMTLITGVVYPLAITGIAQVVFPDKADGSIREVNGQAVGSTLIGQANNDPRYFWPRPSAIGYNPLPSSGTNAGPTNATLAEMVKQRAAEIREANGLDAEAEIPADLLFASASGLDPHISPDAAKLQIDRVATTRGLDRQQVADLVEEYTEKPQLFILGQERVNVLLLNMALDKLGG